MKPDRPIYIVGQWTGDEKQWQVIGVYDVSQDAIDRCNGPHQFVLSHNIGEPCVGSDVPYTGFYPHGKRPTKRFSARKAIKKLIRDFDLSDDSYEIDEIADRYLPVPA